ncbi:protein of unknown function [Caballeronia sp. S22]
MSPANLLQLIVLAALWGASFLFIRVGVAEFGVAPLMALRVGIGAVFLVAMLLARRPFPPPSRRCARAGFSCSPSAFSTPPRRSVSSRMPS